MPNLSTKTKSFEIIVDAFVARNHRMLSFQAANPRDVLSLQNWVNGNACLSWEETDYLTRYDDLLSVAPLGGDSAATRLELWVEDIIVRHFKGLREVLAATPATRVSLNNKLSVNLQNTRQNVSRDQHVFIFSSGTVSRVARMLVLFLITVLLSVPLIICHALDSPSARIAVVTLSLAIFLTILSELASARTLEMFVAGAT
jgi:hypothetical protein